LEFIEKPTGAFKDRYGVEGENDAIDVVMATLDAENFLEKCLYSIYKEIPIRRLIICDGNSKDSTLSILKKFPRVDLHIKSDIISGGKAVEFLISKVNTEWFVLIDSDIFLAEGWFDEMKKHQGRYDVIENSKSILTYHFYREFKEKLEKNYRASHLCHLTKKQAVSNYHCDDGEVFRITDYLFRQSIEKSGYKYGKITTTEHQHNETERIPYESDPKKSYIKIEMKEPERIILNKQMQKEMLVKNAKSVIKYLDPDFLPFTKDRNLDALIKMLDRKWIQNNGPQWIKRYDSISGTTGKMKDGRRVLKDKGLKYLIKRIFRT
jgi:glycosyltransferase involved in cell wall biosynthesis